MTFCYRFDFLMINFVYIVILSAKNTFMIIYDIYFVNKTMVFQYVPSTHLFHSTHLFFQFCEAIFGHKATKQKSHSVRNASAHTL